MFHRLKVLLRRFAGFSIDLIVIVAVAACFYPLMFLTVSGVEFPLFLRNAASIPFALHACLFFFCFDYLQFSPGKKLLGLVIKTMDGHRPSLWQAGIRSILLTLSLELWKLHLLYLPVESASGARLFAAVFSALFWAGVLAPILSISGQTIPDFVSTTYVLSSEDVPKKSRVPIGVLGLLIFAFTIYNVTHKNANKEIIEMVLSEELPAGSQAVVEERYISGKQELGLKFLIDPSMFGSVASETEASKTASLLMRRINEAAARSLTLMSFEDTENGASLTFLQPASFGLLVFQRVMAKQQISAKKIEDLRGFGASAKAFKKADGLMKHGCNVI